MRDYFQRYSQADLRGTDMLYGLAASLAEALTVHQPASSSPLIRVTPAINSRAALRAQPIPIPAVLRRVVLKMSVGSDRIE